MMMQQVGMMQGGMMPQGGMMGGQQPATGGQLMGGQMLQPQMGGQLQGVRPSDLVLPDRMVGGVAESKVARQFCHRGWWGCNSSNPSKAIWTCSAESLPESKRLQLLCDVCTIKLSKLRLYLVYPPLQQRQGYERGRSAPLRISQTRGGSISGHATCG